MWPSVAPFIRQQCCAKTFIGNSNVVAVLADAAAGRLSETSPQPSWRRRSGSGRSTAAAGLHARPPSSSRLSFSSLTSSAPLRQV